MHLKYFSGPESYREFRETGPCVISSSETLGTPYKLLGEGEGRVTFQRNGIPPGKESPLYATEPVLSAMIDQTLLRSMRWIRPGPYRQFQC